MGGIKEPGHSEVTLKKQHRFSEVLVAQVGVVGSILAKSRSNIQPYFVYVDVTAGYGCYPGCSEKNSNCPGLGKRGKCPDRFCDQLSSPYLMVKALGENKARMRSIVFLFEREKKTLEVLESKQKVFEVISEGRAEVVIKGDSIDFLPKLARRVVAKDKQILGLMYLDPNGAKSFSELLPAVEGFYRAREPGRRKPSWVSNRFDLLVNWPVGSQKRVCGQRKEPYYLLHRQIMAFKSRIRKSEAYLVRLSPHDPWQFTFVFFTNWDAKYKSEHPVITLRRRSGDRLFFDPCTEENIKKLFDLGINRYFHEPTRKKKAVDVTQSLPFLESNKK